MRLYIGTLHSNENEFWECVASIKRQTHSNFEHFVFSGLGNVEAHAALYGDFLARKDEFDLLIKIDADMVLTDDDLFVKIEERFQDESLEMLSIDVHDWYSDRLIGGMNTYRNTIQWQGDKGAVFVDKVGISGKRISDSKILAPAALHCPNPSPFQAFHYGVHKAMKVIQPNRSDSERKYWHMYEHWNNLKLTEAHFQQNPDIRLALVLLGAELTYAGHFQPEQVNYKDPVLLEKFSTYEALDLAAVQKQIHRLRRRNWGWLPEHMRQAWFWYKFRQKRCSFYAISKLIQDSLKKNSIA